MSGFTPTAFVLPEDRGLRLCQGPIDLVVKCEGEADAVQSAYASAQRCFNPVLQTLVEELFRLRQELALTASAGQPGFSGPVAQRMLAACQPFRRYRVSPMAAVAGSVADHVLDAVTAVGGIDKAWVNNGGDIAVQVSKGQVFDCGILPDVLSDKLKARFRINSQDGVGGVATSGRATYGQGGRSFSLGIADSVTVLAANAAGADVAATLIANAVDVPGHAAITREPANAIDVDSDLGERLVVTDVGSLSATETDTALASGMALATQFRQWGLIHSAVLTLREQVMVLNSGTDGPVSKPDTRLISASRQLAGEWA